MGRAYSCTWSFSLPTTNILVPLYENATPLREDSQVMTLKERVWEAVEMSNAGNSAYSCTWSCSLPATNILVPSVENVTPVGKMSLDETSRERAGEAEDMSNAAGRAYSCTRPERATTTNILVPSAENATPVMGLFSSDTSRERAKVAVETSNAVNSAYSCTLYESLSATNILWPSPENVTSLEMKLLDDTSRERAKVAVEMSNVPTNPSNADGSATSWGSAMALTAARLESVSVNDTVSESAAVSSSAADSVMPPSAVEPASRTWNFAGSRDSISISASRDVFSTPVSRSRAADKSAIGGGAPSTVTKSVRQLLPDSKIVPDAVTVTAYTERPGIAEVMLRRPSAVISKRPPSPPSPMSYTGFWESNLAFCAEMPPTTPGTSE